MLKTLLSDLNHQGKVHVRFGTKVNEVNKTNPGLNTLLHNTKYIFLKNLHSFTALVITVTYYYWHSSFHHDKACCKINCRVLTMNEQLSGLLV